MARYCPVRTCVSSVKENGAALLAVKQYFKFRNGAGIWSHRTGLPRCSYKRCGLTL
jgi:hypothetical protein